MALASALTDSSSDIFQALADTILDVTQCDSSGLSLLTRDNVGKKFYWPAIAGAWRPHLGGDTPGGFGPRMPAAKECLLVPFYAEGKAVGTIWAIMHSVRRQFDAEDERIMHALGQFASAAYRTMESIDDLRIQIAAREKAETMLRERATGLEAKIRRLVNANIMGVFIWNLEGKIVEANEAFLNMVQYNHENIVSGSVRWRDLTPEEWRGWDELAVANLKATGTVQPYQKEFFRRDGTRVPVLAGAAMLEDGGTDGVAFALDLSDQKRAEEAFRRVEEKARSIVDSALDAVVAMDADGIITDWNKQAEVIFGWPRPEALGRGMAETIIPVQYRLSHQTGLRHFFKTGEGAVLNRRIEITALRRGGEEFPVELTITPLQSGDTWTFSAFIRDISERRRAEKELRESELNLRQMTETIPEMLWSASPDGAVEYGNARVLAYTGLSAGELMGNGWLKSIHPDDAYRVARTWMSSVTTGTPYRVEVRTLRAADRTYRWCVTSALPLLDPQGQILKWHGTIVDMHDWKQAQEELRNTQAELAHINRAMTMGELAASIAHEVNQPLAAIIASGDSCTAWLANEPPNLDKARTAASRVIQAAMQASDIVQRIRALFKKTPSTTTPLEINDVITETVSFVDGEVRRKGVSLNTRLALDLPAVLGDRVQLQQVLLNLVINGAEAMAGAENEPRLLLIQSALTEPHRILVSIADTGPGIDPHQEARLFAPFFTSKPEGLGMGLSISRSIIEAHGGRLWATRNEPRGAIFHFALPTATANE